MFTQQLSFLEAISPQEARYKAVACLDEHRNFHQEFCLSRDVPQALSRVCASGNDTYLSICDFQKPRRAGNLLFGLSAFCFDIDCHDSADPANDALHTYAILQKDLFNSPRFPSPSMVQHTGRGLLVILAFHRAPKQVLPLWLRMGEGFAQAIRDALPPCATLDGTYFDVTRIARVPGTRNTAAGRTSFLLDFSEDPPIYDLNTLRDAYFPHLHPDQYKQRTAQTNNTKLLFTDSALMLHRDRMDDLIRLCELRGHRLDGIREKVLFLYRYWTCFYVGPSGALQAALDFNATFSHPLPHREVLRATRSAEAAFERWRDDKKRGYNYSNTKLIEWLAITPDEQRHLKTIISKAEKASRRATKQQWGNEKRDATRAGKKAERDQTIRELAEQGVSQNEIARRLHCGKATVNKIVNRREEQPCTFPI